MELTNYCKKILDLGALKVGVVPCDQVPFHPEFRKACEVNACGMYGRCWTCPPHAGEIYTLIKIAKSYSYAVVYQTVWTIEDSFDIEGMLEAGKLHNNLAQAITQMLLDEKAVGFLHLGAGGCRLCERCACAENQPCRHPDKALSSLEAYGISVSELAPLANMNYINGQNTVTYFGTILMP